MYRKLVATAALLALSTALAHAQGDYGGVMDTNTGMNIGANLGGNARSPEDKARDEEIERKYQETIKTKIPDKTVKKDPWASVRSAPK